MPERPDNSEPAEGDIDMIVEEATGKPMKPANLTGGIASMRQRIARLEGQKAKLLVQLEIATPTTADGFNQHLASLNKDLATARERLASYEAQLGAQN